METLLYIFLIILIVIGIPILGIILNRKGRKDVGGNEEIFI